MPISTVNENLLIQWQLFRTNTGFANTNAGPDSMNFSLAGINTTTFNQLAPLIYTIAAAGTQTVDLTSLTNTVYETFSLAHALTIMVVPVGSAVKVEPGASNPFSWFLGGTTPSITVTAGGCFMYSEPVVGPGQVVDATHKTLKFTNTGGSTLTLSLLIMGSTT